MTAPSRAASRAPHPVATALGLAAVLIAVGFTLMCVGFCLAHASDAVFGVRP